MLLQYELIQKVCVILQIKSGSKKKDLFFFNCGIHAREWIGPATCMYMIRQVGGKQSFIDSYHGVDLGVVSWVPRNPLSWLEIGWLV